MAKNRELIPEGVRMFKMLNENSGLTIVELIVVIAIIGLLAQFAVPEYLNYRRKAYDVAAMNDGKQLVNVVANNIVSSDDVDYTHNENDGNIIGAVDTGGSSRDPILFLSPNVRARITGDNDISNMGNGYMEAFLYSVGGTVDPTTPSGKREFYCIIDETTGESSFSID